MQTDLFATLDWQDALAQLRDQGLLRDLDVAVARFLQRQCPQAGNEVLLLAAFTSHQQASGHLCLDLNNRELATQLWGSNPPPALTALLPGNVDDWLRQLQQSALVSENGAHSGDTPPGGTPLVLDGGRLYLRRNWSREVAVAVAVGNDLEMTAGNLGLVGRELALPLAAEDERHILEGNLGLLGSVGQWVQRGGHRGLSL